MRVLPCGERALLIELADLGEVLAASAALRRAVSSGVPPWTSVVDVVPAARTVLVRARSMDGLADAVRVVLRDPMPEEPFEVLGATEVEIPVVYDGADLPGVASLTGMSVAEVVARHTAMPWRVAFGGFAPGFAYLAGGDPRLRVPRLATPRTRVPAGAVGLADEFSGIYPTASPGGWQLIGRTDAALFDPSREPPALLRPGATVRFVDVSAETQGGGAFSVRDRSESDTGGSSGDAGSGARGRWLEVLASQLPVLIQDRGRPGFGAIGVGSSGAADRGAYELGARMVGNDAGEAALEVTLGSVKLRAHGAMTAIITGADCPASVGGRRVASRTLFTIGDGETLSLGPSVQGLRTYLSVRGGIGVPAVLGSRATDTLGRLGPAPLLQGSCVPVAEPLPAWYPAIGFAPGPPASAGAVDLEYLPGPRSDWALDDPGGTTWRVGSDLDRVGVRLSGRPLSRRTGELASEGIVRGAIQLPPSGEPVLFMADHPPTGGYPVIGVLTEAAADLAAQLRPGDHCRLILR